MAARVAGVAGLLIACAFAMVALHEKTTVLAVMNLLMVPLVLYIAIQMLRFPDRFRPLFSAVPGVFSRKQIIFIQSIPIALSGLNLVPAIMIFQKSRDITEFRFSVILLTILFSYCYKRDRKTAARSHVTPPATPPSPARGPTAFPSRGHV
ncbi:MAG: hypothetical protein K2Z25_25440 [Beijerinckiaceae bacterium]|nr:hypothetical protein [Beijerinckiaceae bacterium]